MQSPGSSNLKRMRYLLHGDTLYTLITFVPSQHVNDTRHNDFFSKFIIRNDQLNSTIFTSKAKQLLGALQSKDSLDIENAKNMLDKVPFTKADLPFLYNAFLASYPDDTLYYGSVRNKLINVFDGLSDSSTVDFIKENYEKLGDRGSDKLAMLNLLVDYKTTYSYSILKDLFVNKTPTNLGNRISVGYGVTDSLDLARLLYPDIMLLLQNGHFWKDVSNYTYTLLDSNTIEPLMIKPYEKEILFIGFAFMICSTFLIPFVESTSMYVWAALLFLTRVGASFVEIGCESHFFKRVDEQHAGLISFFRMARPLAYIAAPALVALLSYLFIALDVPYGFIFAILSIILVSGMYYTSLIVDTK